MCVWGGGVWFCFLFVCLFVCFCSRCSSKVWKSFVAKLLLLFQLFGVNLTSTLICDAKCSLPLIIGHSIWWFFLLKISKLLSLTILSQNWLGYLKNHWTNTRLVCTLLNAFFMLNPSTAMTVWIYTVYYYCYYYFNLKIVIDIYLERVNITKYSNWVYVQLLLYQKKKKKQKQQNKEKKSSQGTWLWSCIILNTYTPSRCTNQKSNLPLHLWLRNGKWNYRICPKCQGCWIQTCLNMASSPSALFIIIIYTL